MVANAAHEPPAERRAHPLDHLVNDPTGRPPLCDRETFASILEQMALAAAPRRFAVMEEYGDRVDARCAGWGMAFEDHVEVVSVDGTLRWSGSAPEDTLMGFGFGSHIAPRIVWVDPAAETDEEPADGRE